MTQPGIFIEKHLSQKHKDRVESFNSEVFSLAVEGRAVDFNSVLVSVKTAFKEEDQLPENFEI